MSPPAQTALWALDLCVHSYPDDRGCFSSDGHPQVLASRPVCFPSPLSGGAACCPPSPHVRNLAITRTLPSPTGHQAAPVGNVALICPFTDLLSFQPPCFSTLAHDLPNMHSDPKTPRSEILWCEHLAHHEATGASATGPRATRPHTQLAASLSSACGVHGRNGARLLLPGRPAAPRAGLRPGLCHPEAFGTSPTPAPSSGPYCRAE